MKRQLAVQLADLCAQITLHPAPEGHCFALQQPALIEQLLGWE
jgi:hypothetical protein